MRTVWKFPLPYENEIVLMLPAGAEVLHIGMQNGGVVLWALLNPERPVTTRNFRLRGTGHPIDGLVTHVGSTIDEERGLVWHVFEHKEWED